MRLRVTSVTIHLQTSSLSSSIIAAAPAPTSAALVESVHSAEESTKSTTDVADHSVPKNSTGPMSPKLITSMVGSLDKTQASETVIDFCFHLPTRNPVPVPPPTPLRTR